VAEPRPEKVAVVEEERFSSASAALLTEYRGLKVQEMANLRRLLVAAGGEYKVYKNTLVLRAANETGLQVLEPLLVGPTGIAFVGGDVAAVAKVLRDFARTSPALVVKGGLLGTSFLDARSAAALADLPSRDTLLSQIAGALAAPMSKFAGLLKAIPQNLAYGLSALIEQRGGVVTETPAAEEAVAEPAEPEPVAEAEPAAAEPAPEAEPEAEVEAAGSAPEPEAEVATEPPAVVDAEPEAEQVAEVAQEDETEVEPQTAAEVADEPAAEVADEPPAEVVEVDAEAEPAAVDAGPTVEEPEPAAVEEVTEPES
jgi:large subunit ribosomal protein L10